MKQLTFIFFCFPLFCFSQIDTSITYETFELKEDKVYSNFKTTTIDSARSKSALTLAELIQNNSSVFIKSYGTGLSSISFRGTGASHTQVLWNGISLNSPMNGQVDFSLYPTTFFDNVQLNYGASGLNSGNGALGGSVILNNQLNFSPHFKTMFQQAVGSFEHYTSSFATSYSSNRWFFETQLYFTSQKNNYPFTNNTIENSPTEVLKNAEKVQYGFQQAIYKQLKNNVFGIRFWYYNSDRNLVAPITSRTTKENQKDESFRGMAEWKGNINKLHYQFISGIVKNVINYEDESTFIKSENTTYVINNTIITRYYLTNKFNLNNVINIRYETANSNGLNNDKKRFNNSWTFGLNQNFDRLKIEALNRFLQVDEEIKPFAPNLNLIVTLHKTKEVYLKTNTGINYHYPTFNDLFWVQGGDPDLKPEQSNMAEMGLLKKSRVKDITISTEGTVFYNYVTNWIIWLPTEFGYWRPKNLQEVENKGLELSLNLNSTKKKDLHFNSSFHYTYTLSTNKKAKLNNDNSLEKQLIYVPFHKLSFYTAVQYKKQTLTYQFNYTGKRFVTADNEWYMPANFLTDITLSREFDLNTSFSLIGSLKINNIFNQDYQSIAYRPMPGRNFLVSLTLGFNK